MSEEQKEKLGTWMNVLYKSFQAVITSLILLLIMGGAAKGNEILKIPSKHKTLKRRVDVHDTMFIKVLSKLDTLIERDKRELTEREIQRRVDSLIRIEKRRR